MSLRSSTFLSSSSISRSSSKGLGGQGAAVKGTVGYGGGDAVRGMSSFKERLPRDAGRPGKDRLDFLLR